MRNYLRGEMETKYKYNTKEQTFIESAKFTANLIDNKSARILDLGCHRAYLKELLPNSNYTGLNIDKIAPYVEECDLNSNELHFADNEFDYVVATGILEHLFHPDLMLLEIARVLNPKGTAIISLPNDDGICSKWSALVSPIKPFEHQIFNHHWKFSIDTALLFIQRYLHITHVEMYNGIYLKRYNFILKHFPRLCSDIYMICETR